MKILLITIAGTLIASCSDATKGSMMALGKGRSVKCYSGGVLIYEGKTTGKINNEEDSDGYYFTDTNGTYIEINANCILTVNQ